MAYRDFAAARTAGAALLLALSVAGCASNAPETATTAPAPEIAANPIDPKDPLGPWVPHIREASERFDMPEKWIRAVMMRESGGRATVQGRTITSSAGAIGLMQVMPGTYDLMRWQYGLGSDPSDPRDNILAGTAYLREMYDLFGAPGFLAAYNCGPACYAGHLAGNQRLPRETRSYVAALTPVLRGVEPRDPSQSAGATAIEVAVVPATAPKPDSRAEARAAETRVDAKPASRSEPKPTAVAKRETEKAPVQFAAAVDRKPAGRSGSGAPPAVVATAPIAATAVVAAAKPGKPPVRTVETMVAEAVLPPDAAGKGERVVIRFVSQGSGGCGSLQGKDRMCVALAGGNGL